MTDHHTQHQASISKPRSISPIWFLPIVAALLGLWILAQNITNASTSIQIHFENADGIIVNKTRIRYKGVIVGTVKKIELDSSSGVNVIAKIESHAKFMLRENTQFWLVSPKATLTSITGLDTLFSGSYINLQPGNGEDATNFDAVHEQPISIPDNALLVNLQSDNAGSIGVGTPLFYKKIKVGEVAQVRLDKAGQHVNIKAFVKMKHSHLINDGSRFWNISGLQANVSASGINLQLDSLTSLIAGGITFTTPAEGETLSQDHTFTLFDTIDDANAGIPITLTMANVNNLPKGAGIIYKGHGIGRITDINYSREQQQFLLSASINPQFSELITAGAQFWVEKTALSFSKIENLGNLITGDFISFKPAPSSEQPAQAQHEFALQPAPLPAEAALSLALMVDDAAGLNVGDPISYQGIKIGQISALDFSQDGEFIDARIDIQGQYHYLVNRNSQFYRLSGINVKASLQGVELQSSPLEHLISGGIGLHNRFPVAKGSDSDLDNNTRFRLYPSKAMATLGKNVFSKPLQVSLLSKQLPAISVGSPVYYHKLPIGEVSGFDLHKSGLMRTTLEIKGQYKHLINAQSLFWNVSGFKVDAGLSGIDIEAESLMAIVSGGIAVETAPDSVDTRHAQGGYKLFNNYQAATQPDSTISITFDEAYELQVGTQLRLKGLEVGHISELSLTDDNRVLAKVNISPQFSAQISVYGSRFWIVRSEISLNGAKNLSTLISGVYVNVFPGKGKPQTQFNGEQAAPSLSSSNVGLPIVLLANNAGSTEIASPLYHRQIQIGEVIDKQLANDASGVEITLNVYPKYSHLIRENSIFWPASGFNLDIGITGASLKSTSLTSLVKGGINMSTSDKTALQPPADAFTRFNIKNYQDEDWLNWKLAIPKP